MACTWTDRCYSNHTRILTPIYTHSFSHNLYGIFDSSVWRGDGPSSSSCRRRHRQQTGWFLNGNIRAFSCEQEALGRYSQPSIGSSKKSMIQYYYFGGIVESFIFRQALQEGKQSRAQARASAWSSCVSTAKLCRSLVRWKTEPIDGDVRGNAPIESRLG